MHAFPSEETYALPTASICQMPAHVRCFAGLLQRLLRDVYAVHSERLSPYAIILSAYTEGTRFSVISSYRMSRCKASFCIPVFLELGLGLLQQLKQLLEGVVAVLLECVSWQAAQLTYLALQVTPLLLQCRALAQQALYLARLVLSRNHCQHAAGLDVQTFREPCLCRSGIGTYHQLLTT